MSRVQLVVCVLVAAPLGMSSGCSVADAPEAETSREERVPIEPFPTQEGVKLLDHQASPLPQNRPIRFKKLFALYGQGGGQCFGILAFSPDAKVLAAARGEGGYQKNDVTLWDVRSRKLLHVLRHPDNAELTRGGLSGFVSHVTGALCFVPAGDRLVTASWSLNKVFLWDVRSGKLLDTLDTGRTVALGAALAAFPDGKRVICCADSGAIVWDLEAKTHKTLPLEEHVPVRDSWPATYPAPCHSVAFTADGSRFATTVNHVAFAPRILLWDAKTCQVTRAIDTKSRNRRFALAPDGTSVAANYYDPDLPHSFDPTVGRDVVGVWDTASGKKVLAGRLFNWGLFDLAYTRDGKYLLAAGIHKDIIEAGGKPVIGVWEVATGRVVNELAPLSTALGFVPACMAISPDNKLLAVPAGTNIDVYAIEYTAESKPGPEPPATAKP